MKKNEFKFFTKAEYDFIPANVIIVKERNGFLFLFVKDNKWYVQSTNEGKNCPDSENEKNLKLGVKMLKAQIKSV